MPFAGLFARLRDSYTHIRLAILVTLLFTVLVATIFRTPSIIFMAALFFAAPLMGIVAGGFLSRGLTVARAVPETGSVGDIVSGRLSIYNRSPWPAFLVHLRPGGNTQDEASDRDSTATAAGGFAPHEYSRSSRDTARDGRKKASNDAARAADKAASNAATSGIRAAREQAPIVLLGQGETIVPLLRAGERLEWAPQWRLQRRGVHDVPPARAGANDPLRLFSVLRAQTTAHQITVLPRPLRIERLSFLGGAQANPRTPQHAAIVAEALDFHGVRAWRPGEAIRRVHWKSTARTGALHVVEWEESLGRDLTLLLDARSFEALATAARRISANDSPSKTKRDAKRDTAARGTAQWKATQVDEAFEAAVTLVASIAAHLLEGGHRFQMFCWQRETETPSGASLSSSNLFATRIAKRDNNERDGAFGENTPAASQKTTSASVSASKDSAPVLCRHLARSAGDINDMLRMLAQLEALPDVAQNAPATLANLARQAAPLLGRGDSVLLLASTLSDIAGAIDALQLQSPSSSAAQAQVIALDAASFQAAPGASPLAPDSIAPASTPVPVAIAHAMRVVRRGDSLAAALERE